jgi:MerR family transcriptional regulator, light-induced transcriptional regulator
MSRPEPGGRAPTEPTGLSGGDGPDPDPREPFLTVAAVARRLGIAPATLRTWDRRYGVGPSGHATGRHRRYASQDVARLELMRRALVLGASPAEAARYALTGTPVEERSDPVGTPRALRLPGAGRLDRGFARAVLAMDSVAAQRLLAEAIDASGVPRVWDEVIRPVVAALGRRWGCPGSPVELEHLLDECVRSALIRATPLVLRPRNPRPVLLAAAPGERHTLALYGLAATLADRGLGTRMLGAAVPADALAGAIRRASPAAVVLWADLSCHADPALVTVPPRSRQHTRLFVAGPGWRVAGLDPALVLPDGIELAADDIENAVL